MCTFTEDYVQNFEPTGSLRLKSNKYIYSLLNFNLPQPVVVVCFFYIEIKPFRTLNDAYKIVLKMKLVASTYLD